MTKFLPKSLSVLLLVAGALLIQSCKKEKTPDPTAAIVGSWNLTEWKGAIYQENILQYELDVDITDPVVWKFNADGTGFANNIDGTGNFTYETISNNSLKMEANNKEQILHYELSGTSLFIKSERVKYTNDDGIEEEIESHLWFKKQ